MKLGIDERGERRVRWALVALGLVSGSSRSWSRSRSIFASVLVAWASFGLLSE